MNPTQQTERRSVMCRYTGPSTGEKVPCGSCAGNVRHKRFACQHEQRKGEQVTFTDCQTCQHYVVAGLPLPEPEKPAENGFVPDPLFARKLAEPPVIPINGTFLQPPQASRVHQSTPEKLVLINRLAPGDCLVLTGVIESLAACYPGRFQLTALTTTPEVFENNPHVSVNLHLRGQQDHVLPAGSRLLDVSCPLLVEANQRPLHVLEGFLDFVRCQLKLEKLFVTTNRPKLYFSEEEKAATPLVWAKPYFGRPVRYWLLNAGVKGDIRTKLWLGYQKVVDALQGRVTFVQVGAAGHDHPKLSGVIDMVGKTCLRQLINLAKHADGVLSGISFLMHAAAALEKPAVIIAGGIESRAWNSYPEQKYLDTIGQLDCCKHGSCGRSLVVQPAEIPRDPRLNLGVCLRPLPTVPPIAACMGMIQPQAVVDAILGYYAGGVLQTGMQEV
jgi:ADP-heptose:LPS heptosyltransferase